MTNFILIPLLACFVTVFSTFPTTLSSYNSSTSAPDAEFCDREYSCVNCTTARVCAPVAGGQSMEEIDRISCPTYEPWCDPSTGSCTATEPSACATSQEVSNFTCMRDGYFPDLTDCAKYYHCVADVPYMSTCLLNTPYYSPFNQACMSSIYSLYCADRMKPCAGYSGVKVAVPNTDNKLFFDCDGGVPIFVDRCIGAYVFNQTAQTCVPACPYPGLFLSDEDCTKYYRCAYATSALSETTLIMTTNLTCPQGQGFLEEAFQCVDESLVPNCRVKYPGLFN